LVGKNVKHVKMHLHIFQKLKKIPFHVTQNRIIKRMHYEHQFVQVDENVVKYHWMKIIEKEYETLKKEAKACLRK